VLTVTLSYLIGTGLLVAGFRGRIPHADWLLAGHAAAIILIYLIARWPASPLVDLLRDWYPVPLIALAYREMGLIIPAVRQADYDAALASWDLAIFGVHPAVWFEQIQTPLLTEFLQIAYALFVPSVLLVGYLLRSQGRRREFRQYAFVMTLGFLVSYLGYLAVPARGPRFFLHQLQSQPLTGLSAFGWVRDVLDTLESAHYDCFPSGHVEMTVIAWWWSKRVSKTLFWLYGIYTLCILVATTYLRYHYAVDLLAGMATAALVLGLTAYVEGEGGDSVWVSFRLYPSRANGSNASS
jgi:hypothetical protein